MPGKVFLDANILVYAQDAAWPDKQRKSREAIAALVGSGDGVISTQVMQEFYVTATRKLARPLAPARARAIVGRYGTWPVHRIEPEDILQASELEEQSSVSFWDALVVVAASRLGATRLLTEDLQHGHRIAGVQIENPFETPSAG